MAEENSERRQPRSSHTLCENSPNLALKLSNDGCHGDPCDGHNRNYLNDVHVQPETKFKLDSCVEKEEFFNVSESCLSELCNGSDTPGDDVKNRDKSLETPSTESLEETSSKVKDVLQKGCNFLKRKLNDYQHKLKAKWDFTKQNATGKDVVENSEGDDTSSIVETHKMESTTAAMSIESLETRDLSNTAEGKNGNISCTNAVDIGRIDHNRDKENEDGLPGCHDNDCPDDGIQLGEEALSLTPSDETANLRLPARYQSPHPLSRQSAILPQDSFHSDMTQTSQSTSVSGVDALLKNRKVDPEVVLKNLGFGSVEDDSSLCRIPLRFLQKDSEAEGIKIEQILEKNEDLAQLVATMQQQKYGIPLQSHWQLANVISNANAFVSGVQSSVAQSRLNALSEGRVPISILHPANQAALADQGFYDEWTGLTVKPNKRDKRLKSKICKDNLTLDQKRRLYRASHKSWTLIEEEEDGEINFMSESLDDASPLSGHSSVFTTSVESSSDSGVQTFWKWPSGKNLESFDCENFDSNKEATQQGDTQETNKNIDKTVWFTAQTSVENSENADFDSKLDTSSDNSTWSSSTLLQELAGNSIGEDSVFEDETIVTGTDNRKTYMQNSEYSANEIKAICSENRSHIADAREKRKSFQKKKSVSFKDDDNSIEFFDSQTCDSFENQGEGIFLSDNEIKTNASESCNAIQQQHNRISGLDSSPQRTESFSDASESKSNIFRSSLAIQVEERNSAQAKSFNPINGTFLTEKNIDNSEKLSSRSGNYNTEQNENLLKNDHSSGDNSNIIQTRLNNEFENDLENSDSSAINKKTQICLNDVALLSKGLDPENCVPIKKDSDLNLKLNFSKECQKKRQMQGKVCENEVKLKNIKCEKLENEKFDKAKISGNVVKGVESDIKLEIPNSICDPSDSLESTLDSNSKEMNSKNPNSLSLGQSLSTVENSSDEVCSKADSLHCGYSDSAERLNQSEYSKVNCSPAIGQLKFKSDQSLNSMAVREDLIGSTDANETGNNQSETLCHKGKDSDFPLPSGRIFPPSSSISVEVRPGSGPSASPSSSRMVCGQSLGDLSGHGALSRGPSHLPERRRLMFLSPQSNMDESGASDLSSPLNSELNNLNQSVPLNLLGRTNSAHSDSSGFADVDNDNMLDLDLKKMNSYMGSSGDSDMTLGSSINTVLPHLQNSHHGSTSSLSVSSPHSSTPSKSTLSSQTQDKCIGTDIQGLDLIFQVLTPSGEIYHPEQGEETPDERCDNDTDFGFSMFGEKTCRFYESSYCIIPTLYESGLCLPSNDNSTSTQDLNGNPTPQKNMISRYYVDLSPRKSKSSQFTGNLEDGQSNSDYSLKSSDSVETARLLNQLSSLHDELVDSRDDVHMAPDDDLCSEIEREADVSLDRFQINIQQIPEQADYSLCNFSNDAVTDLPFGMSTPLSKMSLPQNLSIPGSQELSVLNFSAGHQPTGHVTFSACQAASTPDVKSQRSEVTEAAIFEYQKLSSLINKPEVKKRRGLGVVTTPKYSGPTHSDTWRGLQSDQRLLEENRLMQQAIDRYKMELRHLENSFNSHYSKVYDMMTEEERDEIEELQLLRAEVYKEVCQTEKLILGRATSLSLSDPSIKRPLASLDVVHQMIELLKEQMYQRTVVIDMDSSMDQILDSSSSSMLSPWEEEVTDLRDEVRREQIIHQRDLEKSFNGLKVSLLDEVKKEIHTGTQSLYKELQEKDRKISAMQSEIENLRDKSFEFTASSPR